MTSSTPFGDNEGFGLGLGGEPEELGAPTGRYIVTLSEEAHGDPSAAAAALRSVAGATNIASTRDFEANALDVDQAAAADATVFEELGISVVTADPERAGSMIAAVDEDPRVLAVRPEQIMHALTPQEVLQRDYLEGFRDAAESLFEHANGGAQRLAEAQRVIEPLAQFTDTSMLTWGLQATGVSRSPHSGHGAPVAVLDTGLDLQHPDFQGRTINGQSFVSGQTVQDGHGHGTHCTGTGCGPERPPTPPGSRRYGVAYGSNIMIGKVLSDQGSGPEAGIIAGMDWAVANRARVISMSLGAPIHQVLPHYEMAGRRALDKGSLIVAAAGNNADRANGNFGFVEPPANSKSIMAVGAVDSQLRIANFSARSSAFAGGQVDLVAPGVQVYSTWLMPRRYHTINGTSMATPHVAGIAALWSQRTGATSEQLWALLVRNAQRLPLLSVDVGAGLVQAPQ
jgi:subtilisin